MTFRTQDPYHLCVCCHFMVKVLIPSMSIFWLHQIFYDFSLQISLLLMIVTMCPKRSFLYETNNAKSGYNSFKILIKTSAVGKWSSMILVIFRNDIYTCSYSLSTTEEKIVYICKILVICNKKSHDSKETYLKNRFCENYLYLLNC